ncbi:MAG: mechanosensitive ion channel family protein [Anaerolineales bacterium]
MGSFSTIFEELTTRFLTVLPKAIAAMVVLVIFLYLSGLISKVVQKALEKRGMDLEIKLVITKVTRWSIIIGGVFVALQQMGFDLSAFLVSLGVVGFTIGFALQDISKNLVAGMLLLLQHPFDIGNAIDVAGFSGTVVDVDLRATEIRTFDGKIVLIPNADVYTNAITNFSRAINRRLDLTIGVACDTDLELARETALDAVVKIEGVLDDPAPQVIYDNFGPSSIDFTLYFWVNTQEQGFLDARDQAVVKINTAFAEKGIEIPYPVQMVITKQNG